MVSCLGKIFERLILLSLNREVKDLKILPKYQMGFREGHSSLNAVAHLRDRAVMAMNGGYSLAVAFLDISKAFDSVSKEGLIWKLRHFGINERVVLMVDSFLSMRSACVVNRQYNSSPLSVQRGVPQGTVMGPILYNLYTADQPLPQLNQEILQYADDTALISRSKRKVLAVSYLQQSVRLFEEFYRDWGLVVNGRKTELIVFGRSKPVGLESITVGG